MLSTCGTLASHCEALGVNGAGDEHCPAWISPKSAKGVSVTARMPADLEAEQIRMALHLRIRVPLWSQTTRGLEMAYGKVARLSMLLFPTHLTLHKEPIAGGGCSCGVNHVRNPLPPQENKKMKAFLMLSVVTSLAAALPALASVMDANANALAKLDDDWSRAAVAKDVDRVVSFYAEDAIAYLPQEPAAI